MRARRLWTLLLVPAFALVACEQPTATDGLAPTDGATAAARGGNPGPPGGSGGPKKGSCDVTVPDDQPTIQGGVDAAAPGDVVCVKPGSGYTEQVVIGKDLTLRGIDGPVLQEPAGPTEFTIPESAGNSWEPVVFAVGGTVSGGAVGGSGTVEVDVRGLTIDGGGEPGPGGPPRQVGVLYRNASGTVAGNTVREMGVGGGETFGILAYGDSDVAIRDNVVSGYERGGIGANGDGGAHPAPTVRITGNDVTGSTGIGEAWGPNGIQVGYGASGQIRDNVVRDNRYSETSATASCIIVFETDAVRVQGNRVENCDTGISVGAWAWFAPSADNVKIQRNSVDQSLFGVFLQAVSFPGFSSDDPSISNAKIVNNDLSGGTIGVEGVTVEGFDGHPDFSPIVDNNKVINNTITGFATRIATSGDTDTKQAANKPFDP